MDRVHSFYPTLGPALSLDRASSKRRDKKWVTEQYGRNDSRFLVLDNLKAVIQSSEDKGQTCIRWFSNAELRILGLKPEKSYFLGLGPTDIAHFVLPIWQAERQKLFDPSNMLVPAVDLRTLALQGGMDAEDLALIGQARALSYWHETHRCCGKCGSYVKVREGGWRLECWACGHNQFPRSDPAVIMAISDGEKCLLGHERRFPEKLYSVLAGFVDPGETIEDAVRREVLEETGIRVGAVSYVASQPWPFPASLMIACNGMALSEDIELDKMELEDASWFSRNDLRQMLSNCHPDGFTVPPPLSIASMLIRQFAEA